MSISYENKEILTQPFYIFSQNRKKYELSESNVGFFQPFDKKYTFREQLKTIVVSPIIGLTEFFNGLISLIENLAIIGVGIITLNGDLIKQGFFEGVAAVVASIIVPITACVVTLAALVSLVTRTFGTLISHINPHYIADKFDDNFPFWIPGDRYLTDNENEPTSSVSFFREKREEYNLSGEDIGFFDSFNETETFGAQLKTIIVSPIIGLTGLCYGVVSLIKNLLIMGAGLLTFSSDLIEQGFVGSLDAVATSIVTPLYACAVTLAALLSVVTRALVTIIPTLSNDDNVDRAWDAPKFRR